MFELFRRLFKKPTQQLDVKAQIRRFIIEHAHEYYDSQYRIDVEKLTQALSVSFKIPHTEELNKAVASFLAAKGQLII
jgi:hypothetical protein